MEWRYIWCFLLVLSLFHEKHRANDGTSRLDRKDSEVSPGTLPSRPQPANARSNIAPWDAEPPSSGDQGSKYSGNVPSINRQPPSASPWSGSSDKPPMPTSVFGGSFYNDSSDNLGQVSPGYAPPNGMDFPGDGDDRRPSIASATTVSSSGSKSSVGGKVHKKLQSFFGEEYKGLEESSRQNSESSSMQSSLPGFAPGGGSQRNRNNSVNDGSMRSGPPSPSSSRPRTPAHAPNSEVTPWVFQDSQVRWPPMHGRHFQVDTDAYYRTRPALPNRSFPIRVITVDTNLRPTAYTCLVTDIIEAMKRSRALTTLILNDLQQVGSSLSACVAMADSHPWPRR